MEEQKKPTETPKTESQKPKQNKEPDSFLPLKYVGYCRAFTAPGETTDMAEFVDFAKFTLCKYANKLWKDPVWDKYSDEEILVEYFSHLYAKDEDLRREFEVAIDAGKELYGSIYDWLDDMVAKNQEEMAQKAEEMEDKISFSPDTLGED